MTGQRMNIKMRDASTQTDMTNDTINQAWNIVQNFEKIQEYWKKKDRQRYWLIGITLGILIAKQLWR